MRPRSNPPLTETGEITLLALDCLSSRLNAGRRSNEALANRAIQLFGLFRVFGEQPVGSQNETGAKPQNPGARPFHPRLEPERDAAANRTTTRV